MPISEEQLVANRANAKSTGPRTPEGRALRYQAQAERHYRRAVEEFDRLKSLRAELPNEAILEVQPEEKETTCAPPDEPISSSQPRARGADGLAVCLCVPRKHHRRKTVRPTVVRAVTWYRRTCLVPAMPG